MIYNTIKELCDEKGISITQLEKEAGLKSGTICKWDEHSPLVKKRNSARFCVVQYLEIPNARMHRLK